MLPLLQQLKLLVLQRLGRISKVLGSQIHAASPPAQAQQGQGVLVTAVFVLAEVGDRQIRDGEEGKSRKRSENI